MDAQITAAGRALSAGDPLGALKRVTLRDDAPALALRGIAMAQLGDFARAKQLLQSAARAFTSKEVMARARCVVAEAEVALASRDLAWPTKRLDSARAMLEAHGDLTNAAHARCLEARRLLLLGRLDEAERTLAQLDPDSLPPALGSVHALVAAGIAMRRLNTAAARTALERAEQNAYLSGIAALLAEVENAHLALSAPAARLVAHGRERLLQLHEVETLLKSATTVVDACRHVVRDGNVVVSLATRPVLFTLARLLGEAWPADVPRDALIAAAFRTRFADDTHRIRLRVELGRLRTALGALVQVHATPRGYVLEPRSTSEIAVLARPIEGKHADVLALLSDGEPWSSSALAMALGASQRSIQRALETLSSADRVQSFGCGRARRWIAPSVPGFTTTLLLPGPLPSG